MWIENNYLNISIHLREGQVFVLKIKSLNTRLSHKLFRKLVYVIFSLILTIESIFYYLAFFMPHNNCAPITQVDAVNAKTKINVQPLFSRPSDDMSRSSFCTISIKSQINDFMLVSQAFYCSTYLSSEYLLGYIMYNFSHLVLALVVLASML